MNKKLFCIILILAFSVPGFAADQNIYLDNAGAGSGTELDPYGSFAEIPWTALAGWVATGHTVFINLKRGSVWRETLVVGAAGVSGRPITIRAYGTGENPIIRMTDRVKGWEPVSDGVYRALQPNSYSYGALVSTNDERMEQYSSLPAMADFAVGYMCGRASSTYVYMHLAADADPDTLNGGEGPEVGARGWGIQNRGYGYITIDGITVYGPGGGPDSEDDDNDDIYAEVIPEASKNSGGIHNKWTNYVTVKNCSVKYQSASGAIFINSSSSDGVVEDSEFDDNWSAIWIENAGSRYRLSRNHITNTAIHVGDSGDKDMMGIWETNNIIIEDTYASGQGYEIEEQGGCITFAVCDGMIVRRNYLKGCGHQGILVGGNLTAGDYGVQIYNNVIDGWGAWEGHVGPEGLGIWYCAIVVGGGGQGTTYGDVKILNNLFINSPDNVPLDETWSPEDQNLHYDAVVAVNAFNYANIDIKNNVFHDGSSQLRELRYTANSYSSREIKGNYFYTPVENASETAVRMANISTDFAYNKLIGSADSTWWQYLSYVSDGYYTNTDPELATLAGGTYTIDGGTDSHLITGGLVLTDGEVETAVSATRVWTPYASMDHATVDRAALGIFSRGPYELSYSVYNRSPADNATDLSLDAIMSWTNPPAAITIDIRVGTCPSPAVVASDQATSVESYDPGTLTAGAEYCWGVDVDHAGGTELGTIYSFTTASGPPPVPANKMSAVASSQGRAVLYSPTAGNIVR